MKDVDDIQPFPIQSETRDRLPPCSVPEWLAKLAHREYAKRHRQEFATIKKRGGFSRAELVALIRGDYTTNGIAQAQADMDEIKEGKSKMEDEKKHTWPPISHGTKVITTEVNPKIEWTKEALSNRQWGAKGIIVMHHDSHGLYYEIQHEDGTIGCYDPSEFQIEAGNK